MYLPLLINFCEPCRGSGLKDQIRGSVCLRSGLPHTWQKQYHVRLTVPDTLFKFHYCSPAVAEHSTNPFLLQASCRENSIDLQQQSSSSSSNRFNEHDVSTRKLGPWSIGYTSKLSKQTQLYFYIAVSGEFPGRNVMFNKTIAGRRRTLLLNVKPARMSVKTVFSFGPHWQCLGILLESSFFFPSITSAAGLTPLYCDVKLYHDTVLTRKDWPASKPVSVHQCWKPASARFPVIATFENLQTTTWPVSEFRTKVRATPAFKGIDYVLILFCAYEVVVVVVVVDFIYSRWSNRQSLLKGTYWRKKKRRKRTKNRNMRRQNLLIKSLWHEL